MLSEHLPRRPRQPRHPTERLLHEPTPLLLLEMTCQMLPQRAEPAGHLRPGHRAGGLVERPPDLDQEVVEFTVLGE